MEVQMQIPFNDLKRHFEATRELVAPAVERVLQSGWYVLGRAGARFEEDFASYCGAQACVGLASGTDALELALRAVGVTAGSRVATVANAGFYTSTALLRRSERRRVFVDVDRATHLIDLDALSKIVAEGVDAVVVTHLYGMLHDMDKLRRMVGPAPAYHRGLRAGAWRGSRARKGRHLRRCGRVQLLIRPRISAPWATAALWWRMTRRSPPKFGCCANTVGIPNTTSRCAAVATAASMKCRRPSCRRSFLISIAGTRDAARHRRALYQRRARIRCVKLPALCGEEAIAHLYVIVCEHRASLREHLAAAGVMTEIHYPVLDYRQAALAGARAWPHLPASEWLSDRILTLPCFPGLTDEEADFVIARINEWRPCIR